MTRDENAIPNALVDAETLTDLDVVDAEEVGGGAGAERPAEGLLDNHVQLLLPA